MLHPTEFTKVLNLFNTAILNFKGYVFCVLGLNVLFLIKIINSIKYEDIFSIALDLFFFLFILFNSLFKLRFIKETSRIVTDIRDYTIAKNEFGYIKK